MALGVEMKIRKMTAAAALGSLTASVALLAGMSGAHAQGAPGAGSYPGSFLVPGSQTSFSVGGYATLLYSYDFGVCTGAFAGSGPGSTILDSKRFQIQDRDPNDFDAFISHGAQAGHNHHGCSDFSVAPSRFNIQTRTPTAFGELKTFIVVDFQNPDFATGKTNSDRLVANLREAYGTLGPFLAGQTVSNFRDSSVEMETVDNGGPTATGRLRMPQVRYTLDFGNGLTLRAAAENSQTKVLDGTSSSLGGGSIGNPIANFSDKIPDFTFKLQYDAPWGHANLRAVVQDNYFHNGTGISQSTFGWGLGVAGTWNVPWFAKDSLNAAFNYGQGAGKDVGGSGSPQKDVVLTSGGTLKNITSWQVQANYVHNWTDTLRTNFGGSYFRQENKRSNFGPSATPSEEQDSSFSSQFKSTWWAGVNLIWSPVPQVDFGVEFARSGTQLESGQKGEQSRINLVSTFRF
jgi:hypothetical protein